ncbi:NlpC/P60 family protein [Streptomyces sp. DSM 44915]|uniref:NlpC/P60 family protein n=1 Tax=Streptomyces chisholmiae TaxID=3075540 RepID=A0ABU2JLQ6_9ACTN|nr:NlpC/P60 family protein [Streptomyces sp. DSM 44915]MDT0265659.1 NlpC/P60 family protein [Streptomyces sp. DSM 44915]
MPRHTTALVALLLAATVVGGPSANATPREAADQPADPAALLTELRELARESGAATEAYNESAERLAAQRAEVARLDALLADARGTLSGARRTAGRLAAAEYRNGGGGELPPVLRLLLTGDEPARALHDTTVARRAAAGQLAEIQRLAEAERTTETLADEAQAAWDEERLLAERERERRDAAHHRMAEVAELLAGLTEEQRSGVTELATRETADAQREFLAAQRPADGSGAAAEGGAVSDAVTDAVTDGRTGDAAGDAAGRQALEWALAQRGKPHRPGAAGPDAFDPAGLALRAWEQAGATVPRTSARAWELLPRVPLDELRPGDLVVYHDDASHIALYAGDGTVVHPPAPGREVAVTPVAGRPILGAVRPRTP